MLILCRILVVVFTILVFIFLISGACSHDYSLVFFILSFVCFFAAIGFESLHTCLEDGVVTVGYFFTQFFDFFFDFSSGQSDYCCSCNCGR